MQPIKTASTNKILGAPEGWNELQHGPCIGLPIVETEDPYMYSYWHVSWAEWFDILLGRRVRLCVVGRQHPPVALDTGE